MKISIKKHFDELKEKHQKLVAAAMSDSANAKKDIASKNQDKSKLETEKQKKEKLLVQNEEAGLEVSKLKTMIQELGGQISKLVADLELLQKREAEFASVVSRDFGREDHLVSILNNAYRCDDATVVNCIEECFKTLPVTITQLDKAGHPQQCRILIGKTQRDLTVKHSGKYFSKNFRPQSLAWVPAVNESTDEDTQESQANNKEELIGVFYDCKKEKFILLEVLKWYNTVKEQRRGDYGSYREVEVQQEFEDAFTDIAISLETVIGDILTKESNELDLEKPYQDNPLLAHISCEIKAQTTANPLFRVCDEELTSADIYKRIKGEWDSFVNCPWSSKIKGPLALLKYHSENGEKARFWSEAYEGHYGFRLRTRDHSWIEGEIYIAEAVKVSSSKMVHYQPNYNHTVQKLGKMFFFASNTRDSRE